MVDLPTRYYVQRQQSDSAEGWRTEGVWFDRERADAFAESLERADLWIDGERVSERVVSVTRVVTAEELEAESGNALAQAEAETTKDLLVRLEEWARPLIRPGDHAE